MRRQSAFSVVELLVTISIITVLTALAVPALKQARAYSRRVLNIHQQREVVTAVTVFACDNQDQFPPSVALCELGNGSYRWMDPRKVTTTKPRRRMQHSSVAGYLDSYLTKPDVLYCPSSPYRSPTWDQAWQAGDHWDHPQTDSQGDPVYGTYNLYWNYVGCLSDGYRPWRGPTSLTGGPGESRLLISDYFGADDWRNRRAFGSCESFTRADVVAERENSSPYWARPRDGDLNERESLGLHLNAGFADGHVSSYGPGETVVLEVSDQPNGTVPYDPIDARWPGYFFIPEKAVPMR